MEIPDRGEEKDSQSADDPAVHAPIIKRGACRASLSNVVLFYAVHRPIPYA